MKLIISAVLVVAIATACAPRAASPNSGATSTATAAATVAAATTTPGSTATSTGQATTAGTITGLVGYPAEGHPAITICAFGATDRSVYVCVDVPQATTPPKSPYTISGIRPGTYQLFGFAAGNDKAGGAYTEYVRCGLRASCSDHTPIDIVVRGGETVRELEVSDWYAPSPSWPTRPR